MVVLIALPFGAASGRHNVFVGVASGIFICFGYFIFLQLGLALGAGGQLPPWLAAWLPKYCSAARRWVLFSRCDERRTERIARTPGAVALALSGQQRHPFHARTAAGVATHRAEAVRVMRASSGSVVLINPTNGLLEIHASQICPPPGAGTQIARRRRHHRLGRPHGQTRPRRRCHARTRVTSCVAREVRSELAVPLEVNGEVRGVINVDSDRAMPSAQTTRNCCEELAQQAAKRHPEHLALRAIPPQSPAARDPGQRQPTINSTLNLNEALQRHHPRSLRIDGRAHVLADDAR